MKRLNYVPHLQYKARGCKAAKRLMKTLVVLFAFPVFAFSQTTYLPQGARETVLLERMEIKAGRDSVLNFSKNKPFSRRMVMTSLLYYYSKMSDERLAYNPDSALIRKGATDERILNKSTHPYPPFSKVDQYNASQILYSNIEYLDSFERSRIKSRRTFLKSFYKTPANFYEVHVPDFSLIVNPVFQYVVGKEANSSEHLFLNTRGVSLRGSIANKLAFAVYVTDNQERDPSYVRQFVNERQAVPGQGYFKNFKGSGYDYFDARGYINFKAAKYIDVTFGYDKNFIGNGQRSLFLSDFSSNMLFLKLSTRIWKFNYQNLFMELTPAYQRGADQFLGKKYAALHHLDLGVTKWLNIGLFEGIVFGKREHFEFGYLNPVIFYRSAEQQNGSPDNAVAGLDAKANLVKHVQLYGQLLLDELKIDELKRKWWGNKFGTQIGVKYIDAFGIPNLDLQGEWNRVRPFTYSHDDSIANYTNYNQPLAHTLGANFNEFIGVVRYQPLPRLLVHAKAIYFKQGKDIGAANYGSNILLPNQPPFRTFEYGFDVGSGALNKIGYASLLLSYELKPNLFVEVNGVYRKQTAASVSDNKSTVIYAGVRWNMHRRDFEF